MTILYKYFSVSIFAVSVATFPEKSCIKLLLMQTETFPAAAASHLKHLTGETGAE